LGLPPKVRAFSAAEDGEELDEQEQDDEDEAEEQDQQEDQELNNEQDPAAEDVPADDDAEVGYLTEERMDGGGRGAGGDDEDEEEDPDFFDADFNPISALQQMSGQRDDGEEQPFHVLAARRRRSVPGTDVRAQLDGSAFIAQ